MRTTRFETTRPITSTQRTYCRASSGGWTTPEFSATRKEALAVGGWEALLAARIEGHKARVQARRRKVRAVYGRRSWRR